MGIIDLNEAITLRDAIAFGAGAFLTSLTWLIVVSVRKRDRDVGDNRRRSSSRFAERGSKSLEFPEHADTRSEYIAPIVIVAIIGLVQTIIGLIGTRDINLDEAKAEAIRAIGIIEDAIGADNYTAAARSKVKAATNKAEVQDIVNDVAEYARRKTGNR